MFMGRQLMRNYVNMFGHANMDAGGSFGQNRWLTRTGTTQAFIGNVCTATGTGAAATPGINQNVSTLYPTVAHPSGIRNGQKIYTKIEVMVTNSVCTKIQITPGAAAGVSINNPISNTWYTLSCIDTMATDLAALTTNIWAIYADAATANGKELKIRNALQVDLFNIVNTSQTDAVLLAWCNANLPWINSAR